MRGDRGEREGGVEEKGRKRTKETANSPSSKEPDTGPDLTTLRS